MSRLVDEIVRIGNRSDRGLVTGPPTGMTRRSWREVHHWARRLSGGLALLGVGAGDAVAVLAENPAEIAAVVQASWMRRACVTMLHQPMPRGDLAAWAEDTARVVSMVGARVVVLGAPFESMAPILSELDIAFRFVSELESAEEIEPIDAAESDVALLQLTSGSTGMPKAVAITHSNLDFNCRSMEFATGADVAVDVMVSWLPLFHDMGMVGFLISPMLGGLEAVCVTPRDFLRDPLLWPRLITQHRGTMTAAPNFAYGVLARRLAAAADGAFDLSSLRFALSGAEPIDPVTVAAFVDAGSRFGMQPSALVAAYGMAEATLGISFSATDAPIALDAVDDDVFHRAAHAAPHENGAGGRSFVLLGRPVPGIEVRVVDGSGCLLPARMVGEFEIRGRQVTGHYVTPDGPRPAVDRDGWLATGDLGYLTETGELVVCDRKKDVIVVSGRNLYPVDIERAAATVDGVRCAAAIRLEAATPRENFCIAVESSAPSDLAEATRIRSAVAAQVFDATGVSPQRVVVLQVGALPKTPSGKLRRAESRRLVATEPAR